MTRAQALKILQAAEEIYPADDDRYLPKRVRINRATLQTIVGQVIIDGIEMGWDMKDIPSVMFMNRDANNHPVGLDKAVPEKSFDIISISAIETKAGITYDTFKGLTVTEAGTLLASAENPAVHRINS